jgi:MFS family permease
MQLGCLAVRFARVDDTAISLPIPAAARRAPGEIIPWRILIVTLLGSALSNMDQSLFGYAVPGVMADLGISLGGIGVLISLSFAAAIGSASVIGPITQWLGARRVLALCVGISAALVGLQALASTTLLFGGARVAGFAVGAA